VKFQTQKQITVYRFAYFSFTRAHSLLNPFITAMKTACS